MDAAGWIGDCEAADLAPYFEPQTITMFLEPAPNIRAYVEVWEIALLGFDR